MTVRNFPGIAILCFLFLLPLQQPVKQFVPVLTYVDESIAFILFLIVVFKIKIIIRSVNMVDYCLVAYLGVLVLSAVINSVPYQVTVLGILATYKSILFFWAGRVIIFEQNQLSRWFKWFAVLVSILALWSIIEKAGWEIWNVELGLGRTVIDQGVFRATGIFTHPKHAGHVFGFFLALYAGLLVPRKKWVYTPMLLLWSVGLYFAYSRGAVLALLAALLLLTAMKLNRKLIIATVIIISVIATFPAFFFSEQIYTKVESVDRALTMAGRDMFKGYDNFSWRVYYCYLTGQVLSDNPLLGVGPGHWAGNVADSLYPSPVYEQYDALPIVYEYSGLDVDWFRTLGESGVLGFLMFSGALYFLVLHWFKRFSAGESSQPFALGMLFASVFMFVESFFNPVFEAPLLSMYFWFFNGWRIGAVSVNTLPPSPLSSPAKDHATATPPSDLASHGR